LDSEASEIRDTIQQLHVYTTAESNLN